MLYDFTMTLPVDRQTRDRLLALIQDQDTLPVRLTVFDRPAHVFMINGAENSSVTIAGHFTGSRVALMDDIIRVPDNA